MSTRRGWPRLRQLGMAACSVVVLSCANVAAQAQAPDITGSWTGVVQLPDHSRFDVTLRLSQDGNSVTGVRMVSAFPGRELDLRGTIDGDTFTWGSLNPNGNLVAFRLTLDKAGKKMSGSGVNATVTGDLFMVLTRED